MNNYFLTNGIDVGIPPSIFRDHKSFTFHFHDFEESLGKKLLHSRPFMSFNHKWRLAVHPEGEDFSQDRMISIRLSKLSMGRISLKFWFAIRNTNGDVMVENNSNAITHFESDEPDAFGIMIRLSAVVDGNILNNGTFTIELRMILGDSKFCQNVIPKNPLNKHIKGLALLACDGDETADVCFEVKSPSDETRPIERVLVHRLVLKACAPDLARLCEECDRTVAVQLTDVEPKVFRLLLAYIYGDETTFFDWETHSKALIDAADKYGVNSLKLEAEVWHVNYFTFTVDNVVDELLYADAMTCPLLKEAAMNYIVDNAKEVMSSDSFKTVLKAE
ncbi:hypothetical protein ACHAXR_002626, partial [Thalassiosira sp. AJA248-18]